ncbi:hypothetical protein APF79_03910 [bacterium BRH_c32]|nr:MAG: hypothetical protein APF79_03910 [bacterium BRH_c32]
MFGTYIKIAFRNLIRLKSFSLINIVGLAVGIACFITLGLFVIDELGYDKFYPNSDRIYRVYTHSIIEGVESNNSKTDGPLAEAIKSNYPEVESYARIGYQGIHTLIYKEKIFREGDVYLVDSTFFSIFNIDLINGDPKTALVNPNSLVITQTAAKRYFGNENPVGKVIKVENEKSYLVTGLIKDFSKKSHFSCEFLLSMSSYNSENIHDWLNALFTTYILVKPGSNVNEFERKLEGIVKEYVAPAAEKFIGIPIQEFLAKGNIYQYKLQPVGDIYLRSQSIYGLDPNTEWNDIKSSDITYLYIFSIVSIFILLIAVINFMNLTTAKSDERAKEVGIRKTLGSNRSDLIKQFISESIITCAISVLLSLLIVELVLPLFNEFVSKNLEMNYFSNYYTIPIIIMFIIIVGLLAGSYPSFYLSALMPSHILKSSKGNKRKSPFRSILVIVQFSISIALIIATIIMKDQLNFMQNKNLGFQKDHLVLIENASNIGDKLEAFKNELRKIPSIKSFTNSSRMFVAGIPGNSFLFNKNSGSDLISAQFLDVDYDFLKTYGIKIKAGRFYSKDYSSDSTNIIINEAMEKACKSNNVLGAKIFALSILAPAKSFNVIGIIKDFNYESLHTTIRPMILRLSDVTQPASVLAIKISSNDFTNTIAKIKAVWNNLDVTGNMYFNFADQKLAGLYEKEEKIGMLITIFSILAIFIAVLGLYGLAIYVTEQRIKEIGIRKVLGGSVFSIIFLLTKDFTKWVLLANLIAIPVAYYFMSKWLQNFAYRIEMNWWAFLLAALIAILISVFTVAIQAFKSAISDPVKTLRYE